MNKFPLIGVLLIAVVLVSGCSSPSSSKVTCNKPYIAVGNDCCLDKNDNDICDKDESYNSQRPVQAFTVEDCNFPILSQLSCQSSKISNGNIALNLKDIKAGAVIIKKIELPAVSCEVEFPGDELQLLPGNIEPNTAILLTGENVTLSETNGTNTHTITFVDIDSFETGKVIVNVDGLQETISDTKIVNGIKITVVSMYISDAGYKVAILVPTSPDASEMRLNEIRKFDIPCTIDKDVLESDILVDLIYYEQIIDTGSLEWQGVYENPKQITVKGWISAIVR